MKFKLWLEGMGIDTDDIQYGKLDAETEKLSKADHPWFKVNYSKLDISPPPKNTSSQTKKELKELEEMSHTTSKKLIKRIRSIDGHQVVPFVEYCKKHDLKVNEKHLKGILEQIEPIGLRLKNKYQRPRPYQIAPQMGFDIKNHNFKTSKSPAYPSNHSLISSVIALYLSDLYPNHKEGFIKIADDIGMSRLYGGVHYRSDHNAARKLAYQLFENSKIPT
jgi:hypothetical protein